MAQLDEARTVADTVAAHVADHNQLHTKANYVFDVMDFGAVGDGVTDDTAALNAAVAAAHASGRGTVFLPPGTYMTDGLSLSGTGVNVEGVGMESILKANTGIAGAVFSLEGWVGPANNLGGLGFFRDFAIEGDGVADATKTHYGMFTDNGGYVMERIGVTATGGPGWYAESGWGCSYRDITVQRPVGADTNDVPYIYFKGWLNANTYQNIIMRSITTDPDGSTVWLIEDDGTFVSSGSSIRDCVVEFTHTPENGAILEFCTNGWDIELPQFFDHATTSDNQTGSCHVRMTDPVNGAGTSYGGNMLWGQVPGDSGGARSIPFGVELEQSRNYVHGVKGYDSRAVHLLSGCTYSGVLLGGQYSGGVSGSSIVDDSGETNNTWNIMPEGEMNLGGGSYLQRGLNGAVQVGKDGGGNLTIGDDSVNGDVALLTTAANAKLYVNSDAVYIRDVAGVNNTIVLAPGGMFAPAIQAVGGHFFSPVVKVTGDASQHATVPILLVEDTSANPMFEAYVDGSVKLNGGGEIHSGTSTPEGAVTAPIGSLFMRTDGGANTTLYVKESGTGNTGWVAK